MIATSVSPAPARDESQPADATTSADHFDTSDLSALTQAQWDILRARFGSRLEAFAQAVYALE